MSSTKIANRSLTRKPPSSFEVLDGEVLLGDDKHSRKARISGALQAAYDFAGVNGSRKLQLAMLDAINACRGL